MNYLHPGFYRKLFFLLLLVKLTDLNAQVPVHEEPRHHPVFQNNEVRILNVILPPGDTSLFHVHTTPSLFIRLSSTITGSQLRGGTASSGKSMAGTILYENLASPNIRTHRVWNADTDTFHVMDVELLFKDTGFVQKPLTSPFLTLEIDTAWIRAYRLSLPKGEDFILRDKNDPFLLVCLNNSSLQIEQSGKIRHQPLKPGSFMDIKRRESFSLKNRGANTVEFILLEFPIQ